MSRNLTLGIVIAVIAVGGFLLVQSQSKTIAPTKTAPDNQTQNQTPEPTAMQEEPSLEEHEARFGKNTIILGTNEFMPKTITVNAGDKVTWENKSGELGAINSDDHPTHQKYGPLNLGEFMDSEHITGKRFELVFDKPGTYGYHDHLHPERKGTVVVR